MRTVTVILGAKNDCHAQHILSRCQRAGIKSVLFDTSSFPAESQISWCPNTLDGALVINNISYKFNEIKSVFWSTIGQLAAPKQKSPSQSRIAMSDSTCALRTFLDEPSIDWVNSWAVFDSHRVKPRQLRQALCLGAKIPQTYIGNDADTVIEFSRKFESTIFKPVYGGAHATLITLDMLAKDRLSRVLRYAPATIQEYIRGTNIRTYVIGTHVYSAEIISESIDFRIDSDPIHVAIELPESVSKLAIEITAGLGMRWTAIDWRRDDCGNYYFLEANPSPMFMHFETLTGYPITERLIELLNHV